MKKLFFLVMMMCIGTFAAQAQKVGEKIEIDHNGSWYKGKIEKAEGDKFYVSYDDWDETWNEWVTADKLRGYATKAPLTKFKVGDKVRVEYGMIPEPAKVIEVGENEYKIEYEKSVYGTKWVKEGQMKKL